MAYQQNDYQQPRQQQNYNQQPPQRANYNDQYGDQYYDEYGNDQGQYTQQDNGYYHQQQGGGWDYENSQQYRGGQQGGSAPMRQPMQARQPPPREQYGQEPGHDRRMYQQPQGQDPRGRPMGPNGRPPQGGMPRGDPRGRGNMPPPHPAQGQGGWPQNGRGRPPVSPLSPMQVSQDNPFPTFPSTKPKSQKSDSLDEAMTLMSIGSQNEAQPRPQGPPQGPPQGLPQGLPQGPSQGRGRGQMMPPQMRGPPPGRGYANPDMQRQDSGHSEGFRGRQEPPPNRAPMNQERPQGPPQQQYNQQSPPRQAFGSGTQRSMTMPQEYVEPGPVAGYHGPESPSYIPPPRPSTAGGTRQNDYARQQPQQQRPPMPQAPPQQQQQQYYQSQHPQDAGDLENLYDDYYGDNTVPHDRQSKASSIDMPNFDAIPESDPKHRRGFSIENHLVTPAPNQSMQAAAPAAAGAAFDQGSQGQNFYNQAARSRSQPDLHGQYAQPNAVFEMPGDAPAVPAIPAGQYRQPPPNSLPTGPRGRGPPPRGMTADGMPNRGPPGQFGQNPAYGGQPPAVQRGYSNASAYSEPGPNAMRNGSPMVFGNQIARPGTAGPIPGRMPSDPMRRPGTTQPRSANPDALPAHPVPVRPGLLQQQDQQGQPVRPPPVRQYHTDPTPMGNGAQPAPATAPPQRPASVPHPVTHDELNRLRNTLKSNPADSATGLLLAKKLVEAASVLADEGGTADNRTRNKNREKFIFEAHKTVKKLVATGSPDAMFYLADCYGQGLLGLQIDTKEAFTLYQSAAKGNHPQAAYRTAVCCEMGHEDGGGTKKDALKAVQWYRRSAALGDPAALYKMGMILLKGLLGQQRNLGEAVNMLKRAADRADEANPHALHELALLYEAPPPGDRIIRDEQYAFSLFIQAAELGYKFSEFRLGQAYEYGLLGCQIDARSSLGWYTRAAAQGEHQSELALSGWYLTGSQGILDQSDTEAYLWARKAACAEPPLAKALFAMGYFTEVGIGCPKSLEEAKRWYGRAASYKFPKAQERLEELKKGGAKAQKGRERLSRTNQKQQDENCVVM
ncbi:hypothetical protein P154DRAFT_440264 [Amniculicola lignicola CBS 123094]|uniref:HCP-like protein n=1 Tax=Amniculicola lignicola CBS 123094 TaxID=1392246 RepID=A0A6A5WJU3_9PLEO|nr:hypothetical protein P154DRAFT_440264 [Amniculicola lignicola CBS 123094]